MLSSSLFNLVFAVMLLFVDGFCFYPVAAPYPIVGWPGARLRMGIDRVVPLAVHLHVCTSAPAPLIEWVSCAADDPIETGTPPHAPLITLRLLASAHMLSIADGANRHMPPRACCHHPRAFLHQHIETQYTIALLPRVIVATSTPP